MEKEIAKELFPEREMAPFFIGVSKKKGGCEMDNYVITIARGFGSGGKQIGLRLSKSLEFRAMKNRFFRWHLIIVESIKHCL